MAATTEKILALLQEIREEQKKQSDSVENLHAEINRLTAIMQILDVSKVEENGGTRNVRTTPPTPVSVTEAEKKSAAKPAGVKKPNISMFFQGKMAEDENFVLEIITQGEKDAIDKNGMAEWEKAAKGNADKLRKKKFDAYYNYIKSKPDMFKELYALKDRYLSDLTHKHTIINQLE